MFEDKTNGIDYYQTSVSLVTQKYTNMQMSFFQIRLPISGTVIYQSYTDR